LEGREASAPKNYCKKWVKKSRGERRYCEIAYFYTT